MLLQLEHVIFKQIGLLAKLTMIGYLQGDIIQIGDNTITINVNGVGYLVHASTIKTVGESIELFINTIVKETEISLWGFESSRELALFEKLISVSGVGGRTGQLIIQTHGFENVIKYISLKDGASLKVTGVGKKTAEKILLELEGKLDDLGYEFDGNDDSQVKLSGAITEDMNNAMDALISLGYQKKDVDAAMKQFRSDESGNIGGYDSQTIIKMMLKYL